jgi:hypothetical protein
MIKRILFAGLLISGAAGATPQAANDPATKPIMDAIFASLTKVLPISLDGEAFEKESNRAQVSAALKELSDNAGVLEAHGRSKDKSFEFVAKSMANDARDIWRWYSRGSWGEARYLLHNLTENCISCHAKLPATVKFPPAEAFFRNAEIAKLPAIERAQLLMATRQFDAAIQVYEELIRSPQTRPAELVMMDAFTDYLKLCIRVKEDMKRPIPVLEFMANRKDLPHFVDLQLSDWISSLRSFAQRPPVKGSDLVIGRSLITAAQKRMEFKVDRSGLVDYIVASKYLNRFVASHDKPSAQLAEAYWLLGITESMIGRSYWLSQTEFYLETAVRMAPKASFAKKAYALLEEQAVMEYSGSSGTNIPDDVQRMLDELKELIR